MSPSLTCTSLAFTWPDGTAVFEGLDVAFGPGRTGLVGVNGSGKSTLLKLIAGELTPADGAFERVEVWADASWVHLDVVLRDRLPARLRVEAPARSSASRRPKPRWPGACAW